MAIIRDVFTFPHPVDDHIPRTVAAMVSLLAVATLVLDMGWLILVLVAGFAARVFTGPTLCPFAQLTIRVIVPAMKQPKKYVAGPPKRFAQSSGLVLSVTAAIFHLGFGLVTPAYILVGIVLIFALLESALGFCAGCFIFARLMDIGVVPKDTCEKCADLSVTR